MTSIAETAWAEMFTRLTATTFPGVALASIRRKRRTNVTRENAPAIHLIEGQAKMNEDKSCDWRWEMDGTIAVFVRDDNGLAAADPFLVEVVARINPEIAPAYSNQVRLELLRIGPNTEVADEDATRVDLDFRFKWGAKRWTLDVAAA